MKSNLTKLDDDDDGFGSRPNRRTRHYVKWDDANGWRDNDELPLPDVLVLLGICEFLRRWTKDGDKNIPTDITDRPLPDVDLLNESIPVAEWPIGRDGKKEPPFKHYCGFTLVGPTTGTMYSYSNCTWGASQLYDDINEAVTTMRVMRGAKCVPVVKPSQRPMNSKRFGKVMRPHLEILDWKILGGNGNAIPPQAPTPQLSGPSTPAPAPKNLTSEAPKPALTQQAKPKKPVPLSDYTLAVMGDVKPVTTAELLNDLLGNLPWDDQ